jgi:four helix bundle protein
MKTQSSKVNGQNYKSKIKSDRVLETSGFLYSAKIEKGIDLKERTYRFSVSVVKFIAESNKDRIFNSIFDQLLRSATSVGANLVEARASSSRREFIKFYEISLKSANEAKYWLCLMRDALAAERNKVTALLNEVDEISKIIAASVISLKRKREF